MRGQAETHLLDLASAQDLTVRVGEHPGLVVPADRELALLRWEDSPEP